MEEKVEEFHWNLKRLIREGYPDGIPLHNLSSVYGHWVKQPVEPKSILPNCESWEDVFTGNPGLRNSFVVVRRDQVPHVKIRPGPETSIDELTNVLELASYANYKLLVQTRNMTGQANVIDQQQHSPDSTSLNNNLSGATGGSGPSTSNATPLAAVQPNVEIPAIKAELPDNNLETESLASPNPTGAIEGSAPETAVTTNAGDLGATPTPVPMESRVLLIDLSSDDDDEASGTINPSRFITVKSEVISPQPDISANNNANEPGDRVVDNPPIPVVEPNVVIKTERVDTNQSVGSEEIRPDDPPSHSITVKMEPVDFGSTRTEAEGTLVVESGNPIKAENLNTQDPGLPEVESPMDLSTLETQEISAPDVATQNSEEPVAGPSRRSSGRPKVQTKLFQIPVQLGGKRPPSTAQLPPSSEKPQSKRTRRDSEVEEPPEAEASPNLNSSSQSENNLATNTPIPNVESSRVRSMHGYGIGHLMSVEDMEAALTALIGPSMTDEEFVVVSEGIANNLPPIERRLDRWIFNEDLTHPNEWIAVPVALPERQDTMDKNSHRRTLFKGGPVTTFLFVEEGWMPADDDIELPKNTIVYGEFVEQLHSGRVTFDVIDCAIILGRDVRHLCLQERRDAFRIYISSMLNDDERPQRVQIRLKNIYQVTDMAHKVFERFSQFYLIETRQEIRCLPDPVEKREHNAVGGIVFMRTWFENDRTDFTFAMDGRFLWWFDTELALTKKNLLYNENENGDTVCLFHFLERIKHANAANRDNP